MKKFWARFKFSNRVYLFFLPLFLICLILILSVINFFTQFWTFQNKIREIPFMIAKEAKFPEIKFSIWLKSLSFNVFMPSQIKIYILGG